jgi:CRP/FNR family transcriptional regulator, polysaccharide utilization system transcription regulator
VLSEFGEASKIITNLAQKSVRERLAEVLLILRETFGENEEGELDIALTREEIANMVGTATESVIRLLSEFKDDDLIEIHGRRLALKNVKELAHVGKVYD